MDLRSLLAVVLGAALGVLCLAYPEGIVRVQLVGRSQRRRGPYGEDEFPQWMIHLVRVAGVALLGVAVFIAVQSL
ncbi:hypothetical protein [Halospeciosus flavus]|uniref:DUF6199 domain-containing protein n=1 Tax=Halospeciosus flavus TaxID=3032283 RepID=A0ABD5Z552_9EURY|nr:hypothetical protein [Halospeciosus flavus]